MDPGAVDAGTGDGFRQIREQLTFQYMLTRDDDALGCRPPMLRQWYHEHFRQRKALQGVPTGHLLVVPQAQATGEPVKTGRAFVASSGH